MQIKEVTMATPHSHLYLEPGTLNSQWKIRYQSTGPSTNQEVDGRGQTESKRDKTTQSKTTRGNPQGNH